MLVSIDSEAADRWLKKRDAEELYSYVDIGGCPITSSDVRTFIDELLLRSRIKSLSEWNSGDIVLYVTVDCSPDHETTFVFSTMVMLAKIEQEGRNDVVISFRHDDQILSYGKGRKEFILENVTTAIDKTFMKYLKANFDL